jgi:hypothetical protein
VAVPPAVGVRCLLLPKRGNSEAECEDACAVNRKLLRFALADGATEGFDSRRWARYLTQGWIHPATPDPSEHDYLAGLRHLSQRFAQRHHGGNPPWFVAAKAAQGSSATFLGIRLILRDSRCRRWEALAIGDCCLFVFSAGRLQTSFPISDAAAFGSHPDAIPSQIASDVALMELVTRGAGELQPGDQLLLATDAAAQWILRSRNNDEASSLLSALLAADHMDLQRQIERARDAGDIRNDDVGLLLIEIPEDLDTQQERV